MRSATRELVADESLDGKLSLNRLISLAAAAVASYAFVKHSISYPLTWDLLIGYSMAMAFSASPTLVGKFIGLRYGGGNAATTPQGEKS